MDGGWGAVGAALTMVGAALAALASLVLVGMGELIAAIVAALLFAVLAGVAVHLDDGRG